MPKPNTMLDLLKDGHINLGEVNVIARAMFNTEVTMAGPEGYLVTGVNFDDLPKHIREFISKAILQFTVENILDANARADDADESSEPTLSEAERYD